MSARRLARQGLLLAEHQQPVASTSSLPPCPACRRSSSTTLTFGAARAHDTHSKQRSSSWAAISRAGQAIFNPSPAAPAPPPVSNATAAELEGAAAELVAEVKLENPDPHRAWALFQQVDLEGKTHTIPAISLHALLPAIHLPPSTRSQRHDQLHVTESTAAARAYEAKVDLIRLRIQQAGGSTSQGDLKAMLEQYRDLSYAPGASKVWDEMMASGYLPATGTCAKAFSTMVRWIEMHERVGGKKVAKVAAQPLVRKAVAMLEELKGDVRRTSVVLEPFFEIVLRAKDAQVFFVAMKAVYGFDVNYPGADVDVSPAVRATQRTMTEKEVCWVLEMLADAGDMSRMIAVFEVFDQPTPRPYDTSFFAHSFTPSSSSSLDEPSPLPHPIGTRAFAFMVQAAGRLGKGHLVRHYFDQLRERWAYETDARITRIESVVGIEQAASAAAKEDGSEDAEPPRLTTRSPRPLGMPLSSAERPYGVPSTLVRDVMKSAKHHYDYPTARFIRGRTSLLLKIMGDQAERISAVLDKLEPAIKAGSPSLTAELPPLSLTLLSHEIDLINLHRLQLRSMHPIIKADSNIVAAYSYYRHRSQGLRDRTKRFEAVLNTGPQGAKKVLSLRPTIRRREKQVLLSKILLVKQRLARLHKLGRAHKGRVEFDHWHAELASLRARADGRGIKQSEEGKVEGEQLFGEGGAMSTSTPGSVVA